MRAIVLSGGGSKGAYQIGFWKAIRKLKIKYDIITGTSVGALNGALMVQNKYSKAFKLWKNMNMKLLFGENATTSSKKIDIFNMYRNNFLKNGGMEVTELQNLINDCIDKKKFFNSPINYGLVTINLSGKKGLQLVKNKIPKDKLTDYLIASASCYPAFQAKNIDGKKFIDGGMFDNLPINLAVSLGADEIIAVDLCAPGIKQRVKNKKNLNIVTIKPNNKLSNFLNFNEEESKRNIQYGYNDTMKIFGKLFGNKYTFKKRNFDSLLEEYQNLFIYNFNTIINTNRLTSILNLEGVNIKNLILNISEDLGKLFHLDDSKIYNYKRYNKILLKKLYSLMKKDKLSKKELSLLSIYQMIKSKDYRHLRVKTILSSKEFIMALYLFTLSEA